ncbi:MAG: hypothetical protein NVSMB32_12130 [Actinomycetota bacterium]
MGSVIPASQLRVYEPLASFCEEERLRWAEYIEADRSPPAAWSYREAFESGAGHVGLLVPVAGEHAYVRRVNGVWLVCPWSPQVSVLTGILAVHEAVPNELADSLREHETSWASTELARLQEAHPTPRDNVLTAAWHVPLRWLAAFDDAERIVTSERTSPKIRPSGPAREAGIVRLRYETDLVTAVARLDRALAILTEADMDDEVVEPVEELADWMRSFDPESAVELDYGSLSGLIPVGDLEADRSAGEIWACLEAMELGDVDESRRRYSLLATWWEQVRSIERTN